MLRVKTVYLTPIETLSLYFNKFAISKAHWRNLLKTLLLLVVITVAFASPENEKVIYGKDDRFDIFEIENKRMLKNASSVAMRVRNASFDIKVHWHRYASFIKPLDLSHPDGENVCSDEKFASQKALGDCSGFLIKKNLLATAAHCVVSIEGEFKDEKTPTCESYSWVFNYEYKVKDSVIDLNAFPMSNLYSCKKVVYAKLTDSNEDYAIIELDREVENARTVSLRHYKKLKLSREVYTIGHPSGLPKKITINGKVINNEKELSSFETNLDTFSGGSGSPVFDRRSHRAIGIIVRGRDDYTYDKKKKCYRVNTCSESTRRCSRMNYEGKAESAIHIKYIIDLMRSLR